MSFLIKSGMTLNLLQTKSGYLYGNPETGPPDKYHCYSRP